MLEMSSLDTRQFRLGFAGDCFNTSWYARAALNMHFGAKDWQVDFVSALGDDIYSQRMRRFMNKNGIGTEHIQTIKDKRAGLYLIHQADGDRHFTYWRDDSAARILAKDVQELQRSLLDATLIYFSGITLAIIGQNGRANLLDVISAAREKGARVAFDPNIRPTLWQSEAELQSSIEQACKNVDTVLPTFDDEAGCFGDTSPEQTVQRYRSWGIEEIVVKNGADASMIFSHGRQIEVSPTPVETVDATGAGDSFNGTYLVSRHEGQSARQSAVAAHKTAAKVVAHSGALVPMDLLG